MVDLHEIGSNIARIPSRTQSHFVITMSSSLTDLADNFDLLIIGTDIPQSLIAGACARVGVSVLHIDGNDYYGGASSSFTLEKFVKLMLGDASDDPDDQGKQHHPQQQLQVTVEPSDQSPSGDIELLANERLIPLSTPSEDECSNVVDWTSIEWAEEKEGEEGTESARETMLKLSRKFSIDLVPKLLFSRGPMVETLIRSGVSRYADFVSVDKLLAYVDGKICQVPCTRGQIFSSSDVPMMDKRRLMKLITASLDDEGYEEVFGKDDHMTFVEYLTREKFSAIMRDYVMNAITMLPRSATTKEGIASLRRFCHSVGRYGQSPLIGCMYGSGELAQCFCRLGAVYGAVYVLRKACASIVVDADAHCITGVVIDGRLIRVKNVVIGGDKYSQQIRSAASTVVTSEDNKESRQSFTPVSHMQRAVVISDAQLRPHDLNEDDEKMKISLMNVDLDDGGALVSVVHEGLGAQTAPRDVSHLQSTGHESASSRFAPLIEKLFVKSTDAPIVERVRQISSCSDSPAHDTKDGEGVEPDAQMPTGENDRRPKVLMTSYWDMPLIGDADKPDERLPSNLHIAPSAGTSVIGYGDMIAKIESWFSSIYPDKVFMPEPIPYEELKKEEEGETEAPSCKDEDMAGLEKAEDGDGFTEV